MSEIPEGHAEEARLELALFDAWAEVTAERDALRAQVEAVRARAAEILRAAEANANIAGESNNGLWLAECEARAFVAKEVLSGLSSSEPVAGPRRSPLDPRPVR